MTFETQKPAHETPFSWLPGEKLHEKMHINWEDHPEFEHQILNLTPETNIEKQLNNVLERYNIPEEQRPLLLDMIREYVNSRDQLRKAYQRWASRRGNKLYESAPLLAEELTEIVNLTQIAKDYEFHTRELRNWLRAKGFKTSNPQIPPYSMEATFPTPTPVATNQTVVH